MIQGDPPSNDEPSVLIAEDNETNMLLVKCILDNILPDATVSEAENGLDAIELYKSECPDIIFMDVRMPVKNGYEATKEIRKLDLNKNTPIIALTAGTEGERERCLQAGMDDYISKPIIQDSIVNAVKKWLPLSTMQIVSNYQVSTIPDDIDDDVHYNREELKKRLGNKEEVLQAVLDASRRGLQQCLISLKKQTNCEDLYSLKETAHKLKGIALSASFTELAKLAADMEQLTSFQHEEVNQNMEQIESEIRHIGTLI